MEFKVKRDDLKYATKVIETIFGNSDVSALFEINAKKNVLTINCGEKNAWISQKIPVTGSKNETFAIEYSTISAINFPKDTINFSLEGRSLSFACGSFKGTLSKLIDKNKVTKHKPLKAITAKYQIDPKLLCEGISYLNYSPILAGKDSKNLSIRITNSGEFIMSTNDSYRGGVFKSTTSAKKFKVNVNFESMRRISNIISGAEIMKFGTDGKQMRVVTESIDCQYPALQVTKPSTSEEFISKLKNAKVSFIADASKLHKACETLFSLVKSSKLDEIKIICSTKKNKLEMKAVTGTANATYTVPIHKKQGKDCSFNISNKIASDLFSLVKVSSKIEVYKDVAVIRSTKQDISYVFPLVQ